MENELKHLFGVKMDLHSNQPLRESPISYITTNV